MADASVQIKFQFQFQDIKVRQLMISDFKINACGFWYWNGTCYDFLILY